MGIRIYRFNHVKMISQDTLGSDWSRSLWSSENQANMKPDNSKILKTITKMEPKWYPMEPKMIPNDVIYAEKARDGALDT